MASSLSSLRTTLRSLLLDSSGLPVWSDDALHQALWEAIAEHSFLFPQRVRVAYTVSDGATAIPLFAVDSLTPVVFGLFAPTLAGAADLIAVSRVELPPGTLIGEDSGQVADFSGSSTVGLAAGSVAQAWRYLGGYLYLSNPASGTEVGTKTLIVETLQSYTQPDVAGTLLWNGPVHDLALLLLLAQRSAYQQLLGWLARDNKPSVGADAALGQIEIAIGRAKSLRERRAVHSRTLDT